MSTHLDHGNTARDLDESEESAFVASMLNGAEESERKAKTKASRIFWHEGNGGYHNAGLAHSARVGHHTQFARALRNTVDQLERNQAITEATNARSLE